MLKRHPVVPLVVAALLSLSLAACGGSSSSSSGGAVASKAGAKPFKVPASGCGSFAAPLPAGDIVANQFDKAQKEGIAGWINYPGANFTVQESAWKNWKPSHGPPYKVAISWGQLVSDYNVELTEGMKASLEKDPDIGEVTVKTTGSNLDTAQQIQQFNQLVQEKPDVILMQAVSPASFIGPINKAAAAGIPTITQSSTIPGNKAVNVDANAYQAAGWAASFVGQQLNGKGNVLQVNALAGSTPDLASVSAYNAVFKNCPNLKKIGEIYGGFSDNIAKSEVLKFTATHPEKIDAALQVAGMTVGVMRGFQQAGRPMPIVPDHFLAKGSLGYWNHTKGYSDIGSTLPPGPGSAAMAEVAIRMLGGQGVKYNAIVGKEPLVDDTTLKDWVEPQWTLSTPGIATGTRDSFLPSSYLKTFFKDPKPLKQ